MENGSFLLTNASGTGFGNDSDSKLYVFRHKETAAPLANPSAKTTWTLAISGSPTGGSYKLVLNGYPTANIAYNATDANIATALNAISAQTGLTGITVTSGVITLPSPGIVQVGDFTLTPPTATVAVS